MPLFSKQRKEKIPEVVQPPPSGLPSSPASRRPPSDSSTRSFTDSQSTISTPAPSYDRYDRYAQSQPQSQLQSREATDGGRGFRGDQHGNQVVDPYARPPQQQPARGQSSQGQSDYYMQDNGALRRAGSGGGPSVAVGSQDRYGGGGGARGRLQGLRQGGGDRFGGAEARAELLSGAPVRTPAREGGPPAEVPDDEEEEVEGIKQNLRVVKQESLASTRNALRIAREATETGTATLERLGDQSDRLANAERNVDMANAYSSRAQDETKEINALNRSIFRPNFNINKESKRAKEEARIQARHDAEREERSEIRREQYTSRERISAARKNMGQGAVGELCSAGARARVKGEERKRYQFEATESDDEVEDEIDDNLDALGHTVGTLKMLAIATGEEVDRSVVQINRLTSKVDRTDSSLIHTTGKLERVGK